jgi:hypothetical protein
MTPRRSIGVTLTAVVTLLGSVLFVLFASLMLLLSLLPKMQPGSPSYLRLALLLESVLFSAVAAWGITTAVGLFRLRNWSRISTIVFSVFLTLCGGSAALSMAFITFPPAPGTPPGLMGYIKAGLVGFYAFLTLLGGWWLYYFNTAAARAQFGTSIEQPESRPLSVSIIAWCLLVGGLLRLKPLSRSLAIGFYAYGAVSGLLAAFLPGYSERTAVLLESLPAGLGEAVRSGGSASLSFWRPGAVAGALLCLVPIWLLVARRQAFASRP